MSIDYVNRCLHTASRLAAIRNQLFSFSLGGLTLQAHSLIPVGSVVGATFEKWDAPRASQFLSPTLARGIELNLLSHRAIQHPERVGDSVAAAAAI